MTIEKSPASTANPKATARSDSSHGVKAKAAGSDGSAGGTGSGFMAILGALGDAPTDTALPGGGTADATLPDTGAAVPAFDASLLLQQNPQIAAAQAAATAAAAATATGSAASGAGLGIAGVGVAGLGGAGRGAGTPFAALAQDSATLAQGAAAQRPGLSPEQPGVDGKSPATPAQGKGGEGAAGKASAQTADLASSAAVATPDLTASQTQGLQHAGAHARAVRDASDSAAATPATGNSTAPASNERTAADKFMAALEQGRAPQAERAVEPLLAPLQAKQEKAQDERAGFSFKTSEPTYSGSTLGVSAPDFSQSGAPAPVMAPEMQVAEQVSYWVSQNVQNAELKLDGLGQTPVQVSISVQGNEAQISFHTDEAATRTMLEGAGAHLKDMLQREGLVLTGVSVGSSGSGEAGGGERRARQNARQGVIAPLQVGSADSAPRLRTDAGRAVDLFV